ncbi:hypothetical protein ACK87K_17990, partial [Mycobacterium intracellulare]|uniref:hypothetical protein n=1 Tax=Mycobacterium intracellulare TaxID=1767 RepID=UPI00269C6A9B
MSFEQDTYHRINQMRAQLGQTVVMPEVNYPRFSSYSVARAGVGWLAWCEVPVRAASYSAGGT